MRIIDTAIPEDRRVNNTTPLGLSRDSYGEGESSGAEGDIEGGGGSETSGSACGDVEACRFRKREVVKDSTIEGLKTLGMVIGKVSNSLPSLPLSLSLSGQGSDGRLTATQKIVVVPVDNDALICNTSVPTIPNEKERVREEEEKTLIVGDEESQYVSASRVSMKSSPTPTSISAKSNGSLKVEMVPHSYSPNATTHSNLIMPTVPLPILPSDSPTGHTHVTHTETFGVGQTCVLDTATLSTAATTTTIPDVSASHLWQAFDHTTAPTYDQFTLPIPLSQSPQDSERKKMERDGDIAVIEAVYGTRESIEERERERMLLGSRNGGERVGLLATLNLDREGDREKERQFVAAMSTRGHPMQRSTSASAYRQGTVSRMSFTINLDLDNSIPVPMFDDDEIDNDELPMRWPFNANMLPATWNQTYGGTMEGEGDVEQGSVVGVLNTGRLSEPSELQLGEGDIGSIVGDVSVVEGESVHM